jgi:RND family efflux transporter MFP subunit
MMRSTWLTIGCLACVTLLGADDPARSADKPPTPVRVQAVQSHVASRGQRYSANINPYTQVDLAFKVGGYITEVLQVKGADGRTRDAQGGDWVKKETILAQVRQIDYLEDVNQAKAQLASAQAAWQQAKAQLAKNQAALTKAQLDFERATNLLATQSMTKSDYDGYNENLGASQASVNEAKAQIEAQRGKVAAAKAQLKQAEINLGDSSLKAPWDGIILQRNIDVGSFVAAGTVGFSIADVRSVKVVFGVPDVMLRQSQLGSPLAITTDSFPGTEFPGRVTAITPSADPQTRVFNIEITVPNPQNQLRPGMVASLQVPGGQLPEPVPVVPLSAIVRPPDNPAGYAVFVVEGQPGKEVARLRPVKVGTVYGDMIAVPEGVRVGDRVITTGTTLLVDGDQVRMIP